MPTTAVRARLDISTISRSPIVMSGWFTDPSERRVNRGANFLNAHTSGQGRCMLPSVATWDVIVVGVRVNDRAQILNTSWTKIPASTPAARWWARFSTRTIQAAPGSCRAR